MMGKFAMKIRKATLAVISAIAAHTSFATEGLGTGLKVNNGSASRADANANAFGLGGGGGMGGGGGKVDFKGGSTYALGLSAAVSPGGCDSSILGGLGLSESIVCREGKHTERMIVLGQVQEPKMLIAAVQYQCGDPDMREAMVKAGIHCQVNLRRSRPVLFATGAVDAQGDTYPGWTDYDYHPADFRKQP